MIKQTRVIAGFPGVGKSFFRASTGSDKTLRISDSDSSQFHWINENGERKENPNFINDYLEHIKSLLMKVDIIFVSTHEKVLLALQENGIDFTIVYPDRSLKEEYIRRYRRRKSPDSFINLLENKFDEWVDVIEEKYYNIPKIKFMRADEYLEKSYLLSCKSVSIEKVKKYIPIYLSGKASYKKNENAEEREDHVFYAGIHEIASTQFQFFEDGKLYVELNASIQRENSINMKEFLIPNDSPTHLHMTLMRSEYQNGIKTSSDILISRHFQKIDHDKCETEWIHFLDQCISFLNKDIEIIKNKKDHYIIDESNTIFHNFSNYGNRIIDYVL